MRVAIPTDLTEVFCPSHAAKSAALRARRRVARGFEYLKVYAPP
jgi:hypothetical protein